MKKNWISVVLLFLLLVNTVFLFAMFKAKPKFAFVKSQELVYNYTGMKEAQSKFNSKQNSLYANIDTLKLEFERAVELFNSDFQSLSAQEKEQRHQKLKVQETNINKYAETIENQLIEEEGEMLTGVLNQVNSFVESFGNEHGYELIFGTTNDGSLLYGRDAHDITDEVLNAINQNYTSGS